MPKRKEPELDPKEQFKRFQEAAKEHGVTDEKARQVAKDFERLSPQRQSKSPK